VDWDLLRVTPPISRSTSRFIDFCLDSVIHQHVREPTRFRGNQTSVFDMIFTRFLHEMRDITVDAPLGNSGHAVLCFKYGRESAPQPLPLFRRIYIRAAKHQLMEHAQRMNWTRGDPNNAEDLWGVLCVNIRSLCISSSTKRRWFKSRVARAMWANRHAFIRYTEFPNQEPTWDYVRERDRAE